MPSTARYARYAVTARSQALRREDIDVSMVVANRGVLTRADPGSTPGRSTLTRHTLDMDDASFEMLKKGVRQAIQIARGARRAPTVVALTADTQRVDTRHDVYITDTKRERDG